MHSILPISLPIAGSQDRFPVRRVFCVGRNYAAHAKEMGMSEKPQAPIFFYKPNDALVCAQAGEILKIPYPPMTDNLHYEIELVLALQQGGKNIAEAAAENCIFGYALGLDMTRRDLQMAAKKNGEPWDMAKGFDHSAPITPIAPKKTMPDLWGQSLSLAVDGVTRQNAPLSDMIWRAPELIAALSRYVELKPGDLIFTGTPEGVGAVKKGDRLNGRCGRLEIQAEIS